jgi:hypothetical protein
LARRRKKMQKIDLKKELKYLYVPSAKKVEFVEVPAFKFVMIDGTIETGKSPETSDAFQEAMGAMYGIAYTLKFMSKLDARNPIDFPVMALEALWWTASGEFDINRKEDWLWTAMILQPDHITAEMYQAAVAQLRKKRDSPAVARLRLETFHEGPSIQVMHVGPYSDEPQTIERMQAFAAENGYSLRGKHHEIYLGDPRRAQPEKLKTVLRHPVAKVA